MQKEVSKEMTLGEVVGNFPEAVPILMEHGLHCIGCHVAAWETIEQGAMAHGMGGRQIEKMLKEINKKISKKSRVAKK